MEIPIYTKKSYSSFALQKYSSLLLLFFTFFSSYGQLLGSDTDTAPSLSTASLIVEPIPDEPGAIFRAVVSLEIESPWHTFWKNPGDIGKAPIFSWNLPKGISFVSLEWPAPTEYRSDSISTFGYDGTVHWIAVFKRDLDSDVDVHIPMSGSISWIACSETRCTPQETRFKIEEVEKRDSLFKEASDNIPKREELLKIRINPEKSSCTVLIPLEKPSHEKENYKDYVADSAELFLENEGLQSSAQAKLLFQETNEPFAIYLEIPKEKIGAFLNTQSLSGTYRYRAIGRYDLSETVIKGSFRDVPVENESSSLSRLQEELPKKEERVLLDVEAAEIVPSISTPIRELCIIAFFTFLGGIFLNVMPCVFPVIGLKVLHLLSLKKGPEKVTSPYFSEKKFSSCGLFFTFGVIAAFWILASILYGFQYYGRAIGWGFQLQEPYFVVGLILFFFAMSLSLFGFYDFGPGIFAKSNSFEEFTQKKLQEGSEIPGSIQIAPVVSTSFMAKEHLLSFVSGFCTACITTPCTGPLLGSVMGFLAITNPVQGFFLFTCLGLGISFPYLLLTQFPALLHILPRPGIWMENCKKIFGFSLLGAIIWLSWVLESQIAHISLPLFLIMLTSMAFSIWCGTLWVSSKRGTRQKIAAFTVITISMSLTLFSGFLLVSSVKEGESSSKRGFFPQVPSSPFSKERLKQELSMGHSVLVEVTAKWCLLCQTNRLAFFSNELQKAFQEEKIVLLIADWTNQNEEITSFLREHGRNSVPTTLYFVSEKEKPKVLPELLTTSALLEIAHEFRSRKNDDSI
ncbi:MAG: protein-disulfide reductase DsbD family protein [Chlamydia sp.]